MAATTQRNRKYNNMDGVLQTILKTHISLSDEEVKKSNAILHEILEQIINKIKEIDPMFAQIYSHFLYGGSFYDGLKIIHPDEYDIHILLNLPSKAQNKVIVSNVPGFVHVQFMYNLAEIFTGNLKGFEKLVSKNKFLESSKLRQWMEKLFQKALNSLPKNGSKYSIQTSHGTFGVSLKKTGPAFTMHIETNDFPIDVDLVPCFIMNDSQWPNKDFRLNPFPTSNPNFYIVPKQPKGMSVPNDHYWLVNLQVQERQLIRGCLHLKPAIKLLKKMKLYLKHDKIASYYIKTVGLWTVDEHQNDSTFYQSSLSYVFMTLLKKYHDYLSKKCIPYYWNKHYNLIKQVNPNAVDNIKNKIAKIIKEVEEKVDQDPFVIAKYLITEEEVIALRIRRLAIGGSS
ncbi:cyclic GMP-AMP synthase-like receptor [Euwallacea similis]|uniref:cyclic GMP-AMP synthase-like receptor n=1 Tax=Euwallacea similis TaxID=1736056 RepID=UPI00344CB7B5